MDFPHFSPGDPAEVGFGLAKSQRNRVDPAELRGQRGQLPQEVPWPGKCVGNQWLMMVSSG